MPSWFTSIISAIFPPTCVHCGAEGAWLCSTGQDILATESSIFNPLAIIGVDQVIVRGSYDCLPLQTLVTKLKYSYWFGLREVLPEVLTPVRSVVPLLDRHSPIIPVPLHPRRQRERGFNQSDLISQALSQVTGLPVRHLLRRTRYTTSQAQLSEAQRMTNIIGAFDLAERVSKVPSSVLLVDDVITTGSTIAACSAILRQHGVKHITAMALAKG